MDDTQQSTVHDEPQETESNNEHGTDEIKVEATKAPTFKFEVTEAVAVEFNQANEQPAAVEFTAQADEQAAAVEFSQADEQPEAVEFNQTSEQPAAVEYCQANEQPAVEVLQQEEIHVSTDQDVHEGQVAGATQVVVSDPNVVDSNDQVQTDMISTANDQEMGLAVAILELIGSQPHMTVNTPVSSQQQQTTEFVDVPVKDAPNQEEHQEIQAVSAIAGNPAYPVSITVIPDSVQIKTKSTPISTELTAVTPELSSTMIGDTTAEMVVIEDFQIKEQNGENNGSKKKRVKNKLEKRKAGDDPGIEEKSPKKKKKLNEMENEEAASTSDDPQSKGKECCLRKDHQLEGSVVVKKLMNNWATGIA